MNDGYPIDYQQVTSKGSSESSTSMSPNVGARDTQSDMEILSPRPALPPTPGVTFLIPNINHLSLYHTKKMLKSNYLLCHWIRTLPKKL